MKDSRNSCEKANDAIRCVAERTLQLKGMESNSSLAKQLNMSRTTWLRFLDKEKEKKLSHLIRVSEHFGVSISYLLGETEEKKILTQKAVPEMIHDRLKDAKGDKTLTSIINIEKKLHMDSTTYYRLANGNMNMTVSRLYELADAFETSVAYLIGESDQK